MFVRFIKRELLISTSIKRNLIPIIISISESFFSCCFDIIFEDASSLFHWSSPATKVGIFHLSMEAFLIIKRPTVRVGHEISNILMIRVGTDFRVGIVAYPDIWGTIWSPRWFRLATLPLFADPLPWKPSVRSNFCKDKFTAKINFKSLNHILIATNNFIMIYAFWRVLVSAYQ